MIVTQHKNTHSTEGWDGNMGQKCFGSVMMSGKNIQIGEDACQFEEEKGHS